MADLNILTEDVIPLSSRAVTSWWFIRSSVGFRGLKLQLQFESRHRHHGRSIPRFSGPAVFYSVDADLGR